MVEGCLRRAAVRVPCWRERPPARNPGIDRNRQWHRPCPRNLHGRFPSPSWFPVEQAGRSRCLERLQALRTLLADDPLSGLSKECRPERTIEVIERALRHQVVDVLGRLISPDGNGHSRH